MSSTVDIGGGERISVDPPAEAPARVGFSKAKGLGGLFSRLIMLFTRAPCSHVWLCYWDRDFDAWMVMEAHTEWRLVPLDAFRRHNQVVALYQPSRSIDAGLREGGRLLGSRYDAEGLLGGLWVLFGEKLRKRWRNPFRSRRMVFCSEGVARVMRAAGYPMGELADLPDDSIRPEQLLALLARDGSEAVTPGPW